MLRFLEPDVDLGWPVSAAPPDSKPSQLHGLAWEHRAWGMWNDTVFPPYSSPMLSGDVASSESRPRSSNVLPELERLYSGSFFLQSQDRDNLQFKSFSPPLVPLEVTAAGPSSSPITCIPGDSGDLMAPASTNSAIATGTPSHTDAMSYSRKRLILGEPDGKKAVYTLQETKRHKIKTMEQVHLAPSADPSASQRQPMKAPVRRSQKIGDKITALQQLVSPFGKTDTASVLNEATIYIKVLHEQIRVLTTPNFPPRSSSVLQDLGGVSTSLHSRGLCLVPVSSPIVDHANQAPNERRAAERKP